jgi:hypothetical protein
MSEIKPGFYAWSCAASLVGEKNYFLVLTRTMSGGGSDNVVKFID